MPNFCEPYLLNIFWNRHVGKPLSQTLLKGMLITMEDLRTVYYKLLDAESEIRERRNLQSTLLTQHIMQYYSFIKV